MNNADRVEKLVLENYPSLTQEARRFALFQRLDYMLHIPISMMNKENVFYVQVCDYLKKHRKDIRKNPYLTKKNKQYLMLFSVAPAFARKAHARLKKLR